MKYLNRILIAVVLSLLGVSVLIAQSKKALDPIYDKAKDETTFFLSPWMTVRLDRNLVRGYPIGVSTMLPSDIVNMVVYVKQKGRNMARPDNVILAFRSGFPEKFRFDVNYGLTVTTELGQREFGSMTITERRRDSESMGVTTPYFWETLELSIKTQDYNQILTAKNVQIKIGNVDTALSAVQLNYLRNIADKHLK